MTQLLVRGEASSTVLSPDEVRDALVHRSGPLRAVSSEPDDGAYARQGATVSGAVQDVVMEPSKTVQMLWDRMQNRDWAGVAELLADDVVVEWPASGERILGRDNYVRINAEYPEGWSINVLRIVPSGNEVVSEVEVPHETLGVHRVASFWTVHNSLIIGGREYWTELGADPSPAWRAPYVQRI